MTVTLISLALMAQQADLPPMPDWPMLAPLRYLQEPQVTPQMTQFVADEVSAGRCVRQRPADGRYTLTLDIAVLIGADGAVRATIPHAIDCSTVEQYSAGLVSAFARNNLVPRVTPTDQWYRTSVTFTWTR